MPCTYSEPLSWTSSRGHQTTRHPSGLLSCVITPECTSFEEVEGQINPLQDELDEIRVTTLRAFHVTESHTCSR